MLQLNELEKKYGSFEAVDKINLTVTRGELFGFLGPNGAGKTTTIKMITGLLSPTYGNILLNGIDVWKKPIESKMKIGYIPDQPFLYDKLTGREFLFFSGGLYELPHNKLKSNVDEMIEQLKIGSWIDKRTEEYSQGMRQRIAIASAFIHQPDLIVVDEPMIGLDPQSAFLVKKLFVDSVKKGTTVFMSTHSLNVVEEICTDVGIINRGKIIFRDKITELHKLKQKHDSSIEELFIELTDDE
ncbi:MAG: ABC transporter [Stygiobacter sp. RIFOXYC12_FULL_38_8]|nr:MAG: ABC transporter [Stygiobacter sp. GWC2_38_9]OGV06036.1 MAG: ABC transporter [Stygiobacter sp. RIFOXYB2_FULL_37_11]OGV13097.1 MAG: ABC transporter [Stygiobacter sp. RIFOXYA2_FULL_38_8]OGV16900.1 MAG: ABC transporter [Stygiobacter sp. RIFOXYC2_FULL_38_25]OGV25433.1 MAG: ABC transporter [Stygiobacter sp. RIFOXYC12_FULL_38_8]OGV82749.1 MAG: ABC transporter [Stygiobacter sp. GWF2_38_21]